MVNPDQKLRELVAAIAAHDSVIADRLITGSPGLATAAFSAGAARAEAKAYFIEAVARYIYAGDTALHFAAAAYEAGMVRKLIAAGAKVRARNRHGDEPLHSASVGQPGSSKWNPAAQAETIIQLIQSGADPNSTNKQGVAPLHKAVRTRCALAVQTLLEYGADPKRPNKNGSTPTALARESTGRSGSGSPEAKAQQREIVQLLEDALRID